MSLDDGLAPDALPQRASRFGRRLFVWFRGTRGVHARKLKPLFGVESPLDGEFRGSDGGKS
jgi:hypothetical protein